MNTALVKPRGWILANCILIAYLRASGSFLTESIQ